MPPTVKSADHTVLHKAHQRIHQSTFAGTLRTRDCNGLVIDASRVDVSGGYELTHVCLIEFTITGDHLQYLLFGSHLVLIVTGSTSLSTEARERQALPEELKMFVAQVGCTSRRRQLMQP